jgi:hypothetical protein
MGEGGCVGSARLLYFVPSWAGCAGEIRRSDWLFVWPPISGRELMKKTFKTRLAVKMLALSGGVMFGALPGDLGCTSFFANAQLASTNFCFLLNCNDGAFGGLIDFCAPVNFTSFVGGVTQQEESFLADCPN